MKFWTGNPAAGNAGEAGFAPTNARSPWTCPATHDDLLSRSWRTSRMTRPQAQRWPARTRLATTGVALISSCLYCASHIKQRIAHPDRAAMHSPGGSHGQRTRRGSGAAARVDTGVAPGVVALAADDGGVVYAGAFGTREVAQDRPMTLDTVVGIASMTKPVTSVAAMQLVEQGRIGLDEPLGAHLPELAAVQVLEGFDDAGTPRLRPPRRPLTLRHLLTHTAGFAYDVWNADMLHYLEYAGIPTIDEGKKACLEQSRSSAIRATAGNTASAPTGSVRPSSASAGSRSRTTSASTSSIPSA